MESWENKALADKLNSLQELPAGYSPNLSAKWEIVEAGLPASKKRRIIPLMVGWSVAAAVLMAIGLVWLNDGKKAKASLAVKEQARKPTVVFQQKQPVETEKFPADTHPSHILQPSRPTTGTKAKPAEELAYQAPPQTTTIPVREDTNQGSRVREDINRGNSDVVLSTDSLSFATARQTDIAASSVEKKPVKKKIYQRDFNDGVLAMDTGFSHPATQHFSIQLNPFRHKAADGEPPARRLQLKQAL